MSSIGGIPPRAGVFVPIARMISFGCHWRRVAMFRVPVIPACWMNPSIFWKAGHSSRRKNRITSYPTGLTRLRRYTSIACGQYKGASALADTACRSWVPGDWNDGMNKVGAQGKGESVWLGFFSITCSCNSLTLHSCMAIRLSSNFAGRSGTASPEYRQHGWDGEWYRRAYFDDGTPAWIGK